MNRLVKIIASCWILSAGILSASAQDTMKGTLEKCFDINDLISKDVTVKGSSQGMAIYGKYGFFFHDKGQVLIIDLKKKELLSTFVIPGLEKSHCNNAGFTREKWSKDSEFPLLYVAECAGKERCHVLDINLKTATVVQKIYYDGNNYYQHYDWCLDTERGFIYTRGGGHGTWREPPEDRPHWCHTMLIQRFALPGKADFSDTGELHLTDSDILDSFTIDGVLFGQGSCIRKGIMYTGEGAPSAKVCRIHAIDLDAHAELEVADVLELGVEPEGFAQRKGWIHVSFHTPKKPRNNVVYRFKPLKPKSVK